MTQPFKIDKSNVEEILSLSPMQEGMLFHYLKDPDSEQYFEQLSLSVSGEINMIFFEKAWNFVTSKNEMLRTLFRWEKLDKPVQIILNRHNTKILTYDFCCDDISESIRKLCDTKIKDKSNKFDLREVPFRVTLCKLGKSQYEMIITNHHILYDGWSTGIILQDFLYAYDTLGKNKILEKMEIFRVKESIKYINDKNKELEQLYWEEYLKDFEGENLIQMKLEGASVRKLDQYTFDISQDLIMEIDSFTKDKKMTLAELVYCAWGILLQKYTNRRDIVFGTTVSGRDSKIKGIENAVGLFINTIPLRIESNGNRSILQLLQEVKKSVRERELYETTALVDIKKYSGISGKKDLFDSLVVVENYPLDNLLNKKGRLLDIVAYSIEEQTNYPLTLSIIRTEYLQLTLTYDKAFMSKEYVRNMSEHFINIIKFIINESEKSVAQLNILTERERNQILYEFNDTKADYPKDKTIHELFEEQVEKTPNNVAVVFEDKELTYKELNEKSNSLARVLRAKGVKSDSIVGIMIERSLEMIIGIIAILKAGGAYLPIDTNYPKERIEYMLKDSESHILLSTESLLDNIEFNGQIIDLLNKELFEGNLSNLEKINSPNDLIYGIYTSGTTGKPKGTIVKHQSFTNLMQWYDNEFKISEKDNVLLMASISFDLAQKNIYAPLIVGGKLTLANKGIINYEKVNRVINENKITIINCAPSMFNPIMEFNKETNYVGLKSLKYIFLGGEPINLKKLNDWINSKECSCEIVNTYGPTECTDIATFYRLKKEENDSVPIGKPISNVKLYILDKDKNLVSVGVQGELYIAGDGMSRGYLNRPELTAEKFAENPFELGTKMYSTGDLTRWMPDGNIEFLGRIDNQVKIRGLRIELGEIENTLLKHEDIKEAAIVVKENKENEKYICAYVVCEREINKLNLKSYLKDRLPEYMIPSCFVQLEEMPLTQNGKLDRKALPEPNLDVVLNEYEAPRNEVEEKLLKIWSEILGIEKVGINDNFFELGGHSLKATVLISKIHKELNREIPLEELFKSPSIKELSKFIENAEENLCSNIEKVEEKEYYETSSAQKRMYILQQFEKDSVAYNMPSVFVLEGEVNKNRLEETFKKLVSRHDVLRTYFETIEDEMVQRIDNSYEFKLVEKKGNEEIETIIDKFVRPFDLEKAPIFRVELVESMEKTYLLIDMHHIMSDGVSMSILIRDFTALYNGEFLETLKLQYKDFAAWQNSFLKLEEMKKQGEYWTNRFNDEIPVLNLPYDYERPVMQSFEGDSVGYEVDEKTTEKIRKLAKEAGTTMHMVLLSAFNILLSKYSGQEDVVVGTPIAGRTHADLQNVMGIFVNTLALRNKLEGCKKYIDFLKEVKENSLKAYESQSYQLEALIERLDIRRDTSRNPLFDVMFNMVDTVNGNDIELDRLLLKQYNRENKISKFDLTLNALENSRTLEFNLEYCTKIFNRETIERLGNHYIKLLGDITNNTEIKISEIELLTEKERNQILYEFNDTKADYTKDNTIQELFEEQVEKTPNNIAVVFEDKELTYKELNEKSNSLARILTSKGIKSDSIVGIMVERSLEMIIGIMAILKAGGAYLPIDPNYPKERKEYMLKDSESHILLSTESLLDNIEFNGQIMDLLNKELFEGELGNLEKTNSPNDLIYVIYTSGTTGNPKGTMVEHQSFTNLMQWYDNEFEISEKDNVLLMASISFDLAQKNIYAPLIVGGKLTLANRGIINYEKANRIISKNKITIINCAPSMFNPIVEFNKEANYAGLKTLKYVFLGGEPINLKKLNDWINSEECFCKIVNTYGPTECTDIATFYRLKKEEINSVPIGKSINNVKLYILDKDKKLVPVGVQGELYIAGDGLSRGYLNRHELTVEKFVENPFELGTKMYKTGDLARWLTDGNIEFLGRIDNQVKIRGFRIELGEIENRFLQHNYIKEAAVVVRENKEKEKYICAYVVSEKEISALNLKSYLNESLPEYMVPSYFVQIEKMPLTSNGKLDRRALPELNKEVGINKYEAPRNQIEEKLSKVWSEVLGVEKVGINDNFFELGGHSLKATVLISKIHKKLNREIPLKELFKSPTIKELSKFIESAEENPYSKIEKVEEQEYYETSSAQKRMYMLQQFDNDSIAYNMPVVFELEGKVDKERIEEIFKNLVTRHEALRTYFEIIEGEIVQKVNTSYEFKLTEKKHNEDIVIITNKFVKPFELEKAPLFRVDLIENREKIYLLIDMHHIISDGISMEILVNEVARLYNGEELVKFKIQYKDFTHWQNKLFKSDKIKKQEEYWLDRFSGEIPVLNMPTDYSRPAVQSFEGSSVDIVLENELTRELNNIAQKTGSTMYMILLAALNILLSKYSGQEDIIVGSPIAGRPHADLENIIGMFVNTLAMRNYLAGDKSYENFLREVRENALRAYENQDCQFEELVGKLNLDRDISRNPLFDIMFTYRDDKRAEESLVELKLKQYIQEEKVSKFDLTFALQECRSEIILKIIYSTRLFNEATIRRMAEHYKNTLIAISSDMQIRIKDIDILSKEEKYKLLYEFNSTDVDYTTLGTIHKQFQKQVCDMPYKTAIVYEDRQLTYKELNEKANGLARSLKKKGVMPNHIIGIMVERSMEMIIGMLAIIKAGGAYLPIDPQYPIDRIAFILEDSKSNILLTQTKYLDKLDFRGLIIDIESDESYEKDRGNLENSNTEKDMAYVIYTSGTTGKPKGVVIEHRNVLNFVFGISEVVYDRYDKPLNIAVVSPYVFDMSVKSIYPSLLLGHTLFIVPNDIRMDGEKLVEYYNRHRIDISDGTPAHIQMILNASRLQRDGLYIKHFIIGGDILQARILKELYEKLKHNMPYITNSYGPTECCVDSTSFLISPEEIEKLDIITIGKPLGNQRIYILNRERNILPIGVSGEIFISGAGVGRGYLFREDLTNEKFLDDPFIKGNKMYKTGDLGKWLTDGNIEILGRADNQVKIRGFRIEIGEIECKLMQHEEVEKAVVTVEQEGEDKYLCAYITGKKPTDLNALRSFMAMDLPSYMIPDCFMQIESIPINSNGKIDRRTLPEPRIILEKRDYQLPQSNLEKRLAEIWEDILKVKDIGINDNFFEMGGQSLKATLLVSRIHKAFNIEMPLKEIFKIPTIKEMSQYLQQSEQNMYVEINPIEEKDYYDTSSAQKRIYILQQLSQESVAYNMPRAVVIGGLFDNVRLEQTVNQLIQRHDILSTSFEMIDKKVVQKINKEAIFNVEYLKAEGHKIDEMINAFVRPFDLGKAPLLRVGLAKLEEKTHVLIIDMHHIISDGVSMNIFVEEFARLYENQELAPLRLQYRDFAHWQNNLFKTDKIKNQKEYWVNIFSGEIPVLNMLTDYPRPTAQSFEGASISFRLDEELTGRLRKVAKETGSTIYMVLLSGINILLSRYSGQEDIIVGSPIAGRPHAELENIIGMFVNTLAIINQPTGDKSYESFLREVRENALRAYENQDYQFEELVGKLNIDRDISRNPIFDVMFTMQNMEKTGPSINSLIFSEYKLCHTVAKFDLLFAASENEKEILISVEYCTKLYKEETIRRMTQYFTNILKQVSLNPKVKIHNIDIIPDEERKKLLQKFNDTYAEYPSSKTIQKLFEEQVRKTPNNIALMFRNEQLTYKELDEKVNALAGSLQKNGVKPNTIVGIMVERSLEMIFGVMAILKAGGAYLPIDARYPEERIKYIIENSKINLLLTQNRFLSKISFDGQIIDLENRDIYENTDLNLVDLSNPRDLAYVIYTSGSTGRPKGVMIEHQSLVNRLTWMQRQYPIGSNDVILQKTPYTFDVSLWELFWWSFTGAKLYILEPDKEKDPQAIIKTIYENKVTTIHFVPSMLKAFLEYIRELNDVRSLTALKRVFASGEALTIKDVQTFEAQISSVNDTELINLYGPTEATVDVTYFNCLSEWYEYSIPIGRPIDNIRLYIVDKYHRIQPIGIAGELCIAGIGLARGYLNNTELTSEKFIEIPYIPEKRIYKTGDLARWLSNGRIEFLGRIDHQVKIRGFRIELEEVENQISNHKHVTETIVIDREDREGMKYLCCYIVADNKLTSEELKIFLAQSLPVYMIPSYFVFLDNMPLNSNGKIARKLLPEPTYNIVSENEYQEPKSDIERIQVLIWQEVLSINKIGVKDNFFHLGGDSIKVIQVISRMRKHGYTLEMRDIFRYPYIEELSKRVKPLNLSSNNKIIEEEVKLTPIQKWFFEQKLKYPEYWNQAVMLFRDEGFEAQYIKKVFDKIVIHHDALRMIYKIDNESILQINRGDMGGLYTLEKYDFTDKQNYEQEIEAICSKTQSMMDFKNGPLVKLALFNTNDGDHLMIAIHHLVVDGVSWRILLEDFSSGYAQLLRNDEIVFQPKSSSYLDWAAMLHEYAASGKVYRDLQHWSSIEKCNIKPIPKDFPISVRRLKDYESVNITLTGDETKILLKYANKAYNTEIDDILLTTLGLTLKEWSGQDKMLLNLEGHGREEISKELDITRTVGWFTEQYPVILDMTDTDDIAHSIKKTKENLRHKGNCGLQYGVLRYLTDGDRKVDIDFKQNPEICFNYFGQLDYDMQDIFRISHLSAGTVINLDNESPYALNIRAMVLDKIFSISFMYNVNEFKHETMSKLGNIFKKNIQLILEHCINKECVELTPSDLGKNQMEIEDYERLLNQYNNFVDSEIESIYYMSPMQEGMLFHSLLARESSVYIESFVFTISGKLDLEKFEYSFNILINRHKVFSTVYIHEGMKKPHQLIFKQRNAKVHFEDISMLEEAEKTVYIENYVKCDRNKGFSLDKDLLMRVAIIKMEEDKYKIIWSYHHILLDGWCTGIVFGDFFKIYNASVEETTADLSEVYPYINYIDWIYQQDNEEAAEYWRNYLYGYSNKAVVPKRQYSNSENKYIAGDYIFTLNRELTCKLEKVAKDNNTTLNAVFQTIWGILLQKYNKLEDVVYGSVTSGRSPEIEGIESMVGLFINTIPIRIKTKRDTTFKNLLHDINNAIAVSSKYDYYSLVDILTQSNIKNELINNILIFENYPINKEIENLCRGELDSFSIQDIKVYEQTNYDFNLMVIPDTEITIKILFNKAVIDEGFLKLLESHFINATNTISENDEILIEHIEIMAGNEKNKLLNEFNQTQCSFELEKSVCDLFEEQVDRNPDMIAVECGNEKLSYKELNERVNVLANYLNIEHGAENNVVMGILIDRSIDMIIAILGVLKSGAAYVPIDPQLPFDRIKNIINDARLEVTLSSIKHVDILNKLQWECPTFDVYLCIDGEDIECIEDIEKNKLMDEKLWEYIGGSASNEIGSGGWISSYTGEEFSKQEMDEYSDNVFLKLKPYLNKNVKILEIGCASGITMFRIAEYVYSYFGTDLSEVIIEKNRTRIEAEDITNIRLKCLKAHEIDSIPDETFDIVIINSVIQYFPGFNYLKDVIKKAISKTCDKGIVFIGDVMDMELKGQLVQSLEEFKVNNPQFKTKTDFTSELFVPRAFFKDLQYDLFSINEVHFSDKNHTIQNELTKFRYDIILSIEKTEKNSIPGQKRKKQLGTGVLEDFESVYRLEKSTNNRLAYIIYTSGSTGKPKGVMIEHRALSNFIYGITQEIDFSQGKIIAAITSISFDIFVLETLVPLTKGVKIVISDERTQTDARLMVELINRHNINMLQMTPGRIQLLLSIPEGIACLEKVKDIIIGGEPFPDYILDKLSTLSDTKLYNVYGPTETTVWSTLKDLSINKEINIGKPIANTQIYIVDTYNNIVPIGVAGEICIAGEGLARGYLNNQLLTDEKFVVNSFTKGKMYKTGDSARWLADGNIQFIERIDNQVKIRGYRIELGDIEYHLQKHMYIKECAVIVKEDANKDKYLCAYIKADKNINTDELRRFLYKTLPEYMIPSDFVHIDTIPLTTSGKVDRRALHEIADSVGQSVEYVPPRNQIDEILASIWAEVLNIRDRISIDRDFFQLGGHSLKATILSSKVHQKFNIELPLAEIFQYTTIKEQSDYLSRLSGNTYIPIEKVEEKDYYPVSSAQKRLYIASAFVDNSTNYNIPMILTLEEKLDEAKIKSTIDQLIDRHEVFRTSFHLVDGTPVQKVHESIDFKIDYMVSEEADLEDCVRDYIRPFDLSRVPLVRVGLIKTSDNLSTLVVDMHHIISDGVSVGILANEFTMLYRGGKLQKQRLAYKDYVNWHKKLLLSKKAAEQESYWIERFEGDIPQLNLPLDFDRPETNRYIGDNVNIKLSTDMSIELKTFAIDNNMTLYMVLLAAYNILLSKYTGQTVHVVGTTISGRQHAELENMIGVFINMLPMKNKVNGNYAIGEFLREVKQNTLEAYQNQDYPYDKLVEKLSVKREANRNPLFDTILDVQNMDINEIKVENLIIKPYHYEKKTAKMDVILIVTDMEERINIDIEYNTDIFKRNTIEELANNYIKIIEQVIENTNMLISQIAFLAPQAKTQLEYKMKIRSKIKEKDLSMDDLFNF